jgi:hypothetical protein
MQEVFAGEGLYFSQAARQVPLPPSREGRPLHQSTIFRWATRGIKLPSGEVLKLEAARVSGKMLTTLAALHRFLAAQQTAESQQMPVIRTPGRRERDHAAAAARLEDKHGI